MRGRNRNNNNNNNNNQHNQNRGHHHHNPLTRVYESNGPEVKIRGTAHHIAEKYLQLARDATSVGDHVTAEAHHQHAEHYLRLIAAAQEQFRQQNPHYQPQPAPQGAGDNDGNGQDDGGDEQPGQTSQGMPSQQNFQQPQQQPQQQPYGGPPPYSAPQPQQQPQYSRPPQQQPQQSHQPQQPAQQPQPNFGNDVGGLPSFITGGQPQQQAPQQAPQYGANGHDNQGGQGDRFPMHRRRRRHRGPNDQPDNRGGNPPDAPGNE